MDIYKQSTQKKSWIFDAQGITKHQRQKLQKVLSIVEEIKKTMTADEHEQSNLNKFNVKSTKPEEEKNVINFYTREILNLLKKKVSSSNKSLKVYINLF
jgi:hypothetical protein